MPGVVVVDHTLPAGTMIDELHTIVACGTPDDFRDNVLYFLL